MNKINFENCFLTYQEFTTLLSSEFPDDKAKILSDKINKRVLINKNTMYIYDTELKVYTSINYDKDAPITNDNYLLNCMGLIIRNSYKSFNPEQQQVLKINYPIQMKKDKAGSLAVFADTFFECLKTQVKLNLTNNNINFYDPNKYEIHFKNGYWDLKEGKFKQREFNKHFISIYINRNFTQPREHVIEYIMAELTKIMPVKDDKNYIMFKIGGSLSGDATDDQTNLFLLGAGSNGKSVIMKMLKYAIDVYMIELKNNTFTEGNTKIDKILNEFKENSYLRMAWINEMEDKKLDQSLFKSFCEGLLQTTSLYKDGLNNFKHFCKLIFTSNTFPRIKIDGGVVRRIEAYEHESRFVDNIKDVDEKNNVYLKDVKFLDKFENDDEYKNAFFLICAKYCKEWIEDKNKYQPTDKFKETKECVVNLNDIVQNFIDEKLDITTSETNRMSKTTMHELFKASNDKSLMTDLQLISALKQKGIKWDAKKRDPEGKQGTFVCVKEKEIMEDNALDFGTQYLNEKQESAIIQELREENNELKKKLKEMEEMIRQLQTNQKPEPKPEPKPEQDKKLSFKNIDELDKHTTKVKRTKRAVVHMVDEAKAKFNNDDIDYILDFIN